MTTVTAADTESTKARKPIVLTPEQKRASQLRRDASMLQRLAEGSSQPQAMLDLAASKMAEADALAPSYAVNRNERITTLTETEWEAVQDYILQDFRAHLQELASLRKLKAIADEHAVA